jgi:hypothetical protein
MRSATIERSLAERNAFYAVGTADSQPEDWNEYGRDASANNRPGAVVRRIILAVGAFVLLSGAIQVAIKLAHIV